MPGNKFLTTNLATGGSTEVHGVQVGGAGSANAIPALGVNGTFDVTMLPSGVGPDTYLMTASEAITAGSLVNIWNNSGAFGVRNADNSATGKEAHGFVLAAVAANAQATVYLGGINTSASGLTPGDQFLGAAGATTATPPTAAGAVVQRVGVALAATALQFDPLPPILLA